MNVTRVMLTLSLIISLAVLSSCGGGGNADGALAAYPDGDYYYVTGANIGKILKSTFVENVADEFDQVDDTIDRMEEPFEDLGLKDASAAGMMIQVSGEYDATYMGGPFKLEDLQEYYEDEQDWEWEEDEVDGRKYYKDDDDNEWSSALFMHAGGFIRGYQKEIEEMLEAMADGDDRMVDSDEYKDAASLVDMNAEVFAFTMQDDIGKDYAENLRYSLEYNESLADVIDDDLVDAAEEAIAAGISIYVGNDVRFVAKVKFDDADVIDDIIEFIEDDVEDLIDSTIENMGYYPFGDYMEQDDFEDLMEELREEVKVNRSGDVLVLELRVTWEQIEDKLK